MRLTRTALVLAFLLAGAGRLLAQQTYTLDDLTGLALSNNPDILQLQSAMQADEGELAGARSSLFPTVKFSNTNTYVGNPQAPYILSKGSLGTLPLVPPFPLPEQDVTVVEGGEHFQLNYSVDMQMPLFMWGRIRSNIALRKNIVEADNLKLAKQRDETRTMTVINYYSLYYLNELDSLLNKQKQVADKMLGIARDSYTAGEITDAALTEKRMAIREITHAIVAADRQRETALRNLRYLTGIPTLAIDMVSFGAVDTTLSGAKLPSEAELTDRALGINRDIRLAAVSEKVHESRVDIARSGTLAKPDLSLDVQFGYGGPRLPFLGADWSSKDNWIANVTVAVNSTIFDGGKSGAEVATAQAQLAQAKYGRQAAVRNVSKYIAQTLSELESIREDISYFESRVSDMQELEKFQQHLLDIGTGSRLEYFQKRVDVFTERAQVIQQKLSYASRYFMLRDVAGSF